MTLLGRDHYRALFESESRYVIRTVDFAPTSIRRYNFWPQGSARFCAAVMSAVAFAAALHSSVSDRPELAGSLAPEAHASAPMIFSSLPSASATEGLGARDERGQDLHLAGAGGVLIPAALRAAKQNEREGGAAGGSAKNASMRTFDESGFEPIRRKG